MRVTIIIKWISHYRLSFYEALKKELALQDIELALIYGEPINLADRQKKDWVDVQWGKKILNIGVGSGDKLLWQPVLAHLHGADLIIVEHANKLLLNYLLQVRRPFVKQKLAFWGHGRNFQSSNTLVSVMKEKLKNSLMYHVDWWFAYNGLCAFEIGQKGFPANKITSIENAVDTAELKKFGGDVSDNDLFFFKQKFRISGDNIAVFCGGMFSEKRLPFLLESAMEVKKRIPDFELLFVGAGIEQGYVEIAAEKYSWIHYLGPLFGKDKVLAMKAAKIYLMPGLIGLGVLDAFALRLPVVTTDYEFHSPEISYVKNMENGIVTANDIESYTDAVIKIFMNHNLMFDLKKGCEKASEKYSIENMAKNFSDGVVKCLSA